MKSSTSTPDYLLFRFIQNSKRADIYDLTNDPENPPFTFFRLSKPRLPKFIKQGAKFILESWKCFDKIAFTGLVLTPFNQWYYGDLVLINPKTKKKRKSFILVEFKGVEVDIYYFRSYTLYPAIRLDFIKRFITAIR